MPHIIARFFFGPCLRPANQAKEPQVALTTSLYWKRLPCRPSTSHRAQRERFFCTSFPNPLRPPSNLARVERGGREEIQFGTALQQRATGSREGGRVQRGLRRRGEGDAVCGITITPPLHSPDRGEKRKEGRGPRLSQTGRARGSMIFGQFRVPISVSSYS